MKHIEEVLTELSSALPENWSLEKESRSLRSFNVLDTYLCSLLSSGSALLEFEGNPGSVELIPAEIEEKIDSPLLPSFTPDILTNQELRNIIGNGIGEWRLGVRARGSENTERYRLKNEDEKGIARIALRTLRCVGEEPVTIVKIQPYRGYDEEILSVRRGLEAMYPAAAAMPVFYRSLPDSVRGPSMQLPAIEPSERAREAVINLQQHILNRVRHYEPGVIEDTDPEVLHQYRVSMRRMRSLVALLPVVFSPAERKTLSTRLKSAMQGTNRLRDLDVQAVEITAIGASLPPAIHSGLDGLLSRLRKERNLAFKSVSKALLADSFDKRFSPVIKVLAEPEGQHEETISVMLSAAIQRRYRKITKEIRGFDDNVRPEQLHGLRVSCKKLRYLLEFFPQLLQQEIVKPLLKDLKKLQNLLGRYNDLSVMETFLLDQAEHHTEDETGLMAIGAIIMRMHESRSQLTESCIKNARNFCSETHKGLVRAAVKGEKE